MTPVPPPQEPAQLQPLVIHPLPPGVPLLQRITRSVSQTNSLSQDSISMPLPPSPVCHRITRSNSTSSTASSTASVFPPTPVNRPQCPKCRKYYSEKYFPRHKCVGFYDFLYSINIDDNIIVKFLSN